MKEPIRITLIGMLDHGDYALEAERLRLAVEETAREADIEDLLVVAEDAACINSNHRREVDRLKEAGAKVKKALQLACRDMAPFGCPETLDLRGCNNSCTQAENDEKRAKCWVNYYLEAAREEDQC